MKKIMTTLLAVVLALSMLPVTALAEVTTPGISTEIPTEEVKPLSAECFVKGDCGDQPVTATQHDGYIEVKVTGTAKKQMSGTGAGTSGATGKEAYWAGWRINLYTVAAKDYDNLYIWSGIDLTSLQQAAADDNNAVKAIINDKDGEEFYCDDHSLGDKWGPGDHWFCYELRSAEGTPLTAKTYCKVNMDEVKKLDDEPTPTPPVEKTDVCKIGETGYATLLEAVTKAKDGDTIILLADVDEETAETVTVPNAVTIKGDGHSVNLGFTNGNENARAMPVLRVEKALTLEGVSMTVNGCDVTIEGKAKHNGTAFTLANGAELNLKANSTLTLQNLSRGMIMSSGTNPSKLNVEENSTLSFNNIDGNATNGGLITVTNSTVNLTAVCNNGLSAQAVKLENAKVNADTVGCAVITSKDEAKNGTKNPGIDIKGSAISIKNSGSGLPLKSQWSNIQGLIAFNNKDAGSLAIENTAFTLTDNKDQNGKAINTIHVAAGKADIKAPAGVTVANEEGNTGTVTVNGKEVKPGENHKVPSSGGGSSSGGSWSGYYYSVNPVGSSTWKPGDKGLAFTAGTTEKLSEVRVDYNTLAKGNYIVAKDGTVTLKANYLRTLAEGWYTLTLVFPDGEGSVSFTVEGTGTGLTQNPETGDHSFVAAAVVLAAVSVIGMAAASRKK